MATEVGHLEQGERESEREEGKKNTNDTCTPDESIQQICTQILEIYLRRERELYRVCANTTHDLISARNLHSRVFDNVESDDLYQKITRKLKL